MNSQNEKPFPYPRVEIEWNDITALTHQTWFSKEDILECRMSICYDVCYLIKETDREIYTASSIGFDDDGSIEFGNPTIYPKGCIRRVQRI